MEHVQQRLRHDGLLGFAPIALMDLSALRSAQRADNKSAATA